jgi:hypothetical protein
MFEGQDFLVEAGDRGRAISAIGTYEGAIEVVNLDCRTIRRFDATTQMGLVVIAEDDARLDDLNGASAAVLDALGGATFEESDKCVDRVQPGPAFEAPTDRSVVFIGGPNEDLFAIDPGRQDVTMLTDDAAWSQTLTASSDGTVIAYDGLGPTGHSVFSVTPGAEPTVAVDGAWGAAVSSDGSSVAYLRGDGGNDEGAVFVRDGSDSERRVADHSWRITWSPAGDWLAYEVFGSSVAQTDLFIVRPDGTGSLRLTAPEQRGRFPVWAPDGSRLAWAINPPEREGVDEGPPPSRIVLFEADGSSHELPGQPGGGWIPVAWSPDGSKLLVEVFNEEIGWLSSVDLTTGEIVQVSHPSGYDTDTGVGWSPDGKALLFLRGHGSEFSDLWIADAKGDDAHLLVTGVTEAAWGPKR